MSPLRQRMVEAMQVRGLSVRTIECYTESISRLSRHHGGTNPARLTPQQIEAYLLHLVQDRKLSYSSVNHAASACRFLFETVLGRPNELRHLRPPMAKVPQRQPELLSRQEISRLFEACPHPGHRMLLQTLYAGGLRISEACQLQVGDIDSNPDRMMLRVRAGKGGADRYTLLSPSLLAALRTHCLTYRCHKQSPGWLPTLADVLRLHGQDYLSRHSLSTPQAKAWRAICACRTAAMGGQQLACSECGHSHWQYHSCRNRHCPTCGARAKDAWLQARVAQVLDVPYTHLVFALPHEFNALYRQQARAVIDALFASVSQTLIEFAANPRWMGVAGGKPAFSLVLHTWSQDLGVHIHLHAIMAKTPLGGAAQVLQYLSRYTHRTAMGNERILSLQGDEVVFSARAKRGTGQAGKQSKKRTLRMRAPDFIGRFLQHVLPSGLKRIRHYGLLANPNGAQLTQAKAALHMPAPNPQAQECAQDFMARLARVDIQQCPVCQRGRMGVVQTLAGAKRLPDPLDKSGSRKANGRAPPAQGP